MSDRSDSFVFIHAEQGGKLTPEDRKLIRRRSKPSTYKRSKAVKGSGVKWIAYGNTLSHGKRLLTVSIPVSPGVQQCVVPYEARSADRLEDREEVIRPKDAERGSTVGKSIALPPAYIPLVRYAGDLDPHSIGILHSSSFPLTFSPNPTFASARS